MDTWLPVIISCLGSVLASSGFWAYMMKRDKERAATTRLLMGLGYDKIVARGMEYIDRGFITKDEYEDFQKYLYEPYKALGGNGTGDRIMQGVTNLKLVHPNRYPQFDNPEGNTRVRVHVAGEAAPE